MANFLARPFQFMPLGAEIERGPKHRLVRNMIVVDDPSLSHERYAIVTVNPEPQDHLKRTILDEVVRIMTEDFRLTVPNTFVYPLAIGMVAFMDVMLRDQFIRESPHQFDEDVLFSFVPRDEGLNMRTCPFEYSAWILFLAFPMDYQIYRYINKAVSCFAKLDLWHMPGQNKERVLLKFPIAW